YKLANSIRRDPVKTLESHYAIFDADYCDIRNAAGADRTPYPEIIFPADLRWKQDPIYSFLYRRPN
ncbi:MAG: hypothetical protein ACK518_01005, partial [bacterium]